MHVTAGDENLIMAGTYLPIKVMLSLLKVGEQRDPTLQSRNLFCLDWLETTVLH